MTAVREIDRSGRSLVPAYAYGLASRPTGLLRAVVGSCVAVCVYEPATGIGGLAHLAVPDDDLLDAMLSALVERTGKENKICVKLFGGANVIVGMRPIGSLNADFVQDFVRRRGLLLVASDLGGELGRRVEFNAGSGRVRVKKMAALAWGAPSAGIENGQ